ncbi:MAG: phage major capsid protein [Bacillota bacterium]
MEKRNFELRLAGTDALTGYAAVFNQDAELPFRERILPGAFRETLESDRDVLALVDHDTAKVIGRRSNGTLTLKEDAHGLRVEVRPNLETTYGRDVLAAVKRGDLKQMSIGFVCREDRYTNGLREILSAELMEVSVVSMPAYAGTTIHTRKKEEENMRVEEREIRQKLAKLRKENKVLLEKEELTTDELRQVADLAREIRNLEVQVETLKPEPKPVITAAPVDEQRAAFISYLRGREFDARAMTLGTDTTGGFLAPEAFLTELVRKLAELTVMRGQARVLTITQGSVKVPKLTDTVTAAWTAEAAAITPGDPTFGQLEFIPKKLAALTLVSNELLADSGIPVDTLLAGLFAEKFAELEDAAYLKGDGIGKPKGLLTEAAISRVTTASATTIAADELINLYDALPPAYRGNAVWVMNPATMNILRRLKDGAGQYLLVTGLAGAAPANILGRPVLLTNQVDTVAAGKDVIIFGDLARTYYIVDRQGVEVQRSTDRYFEQDLTAFRAIKRTDGGVVLPEACRILKMAAA